MVGDVVFGEGEPAHFFEEGVFLGCDDLLRGGGMRRGELRMCVNVIMM